jgi:TBCC domain-containing protein 1
VAGADGIALITIANLLVVDAPSPDASRGEMRDPWRQSDAAPSPSLAPATPPAPATSSPAALLRPQREAFEHGLLPIPKLIFPEGMLAQTLAQLKEKLAASVPDGRVRAAALAKAQQIPQEQAALALGTLAAMLPAEDPVLGDGAMDGAAADIRDVLLFLYIQSYKRLVHLRVRWVPLCALPDPGQD